jgi:DNA-binding transcriptional regulator YdaS (Cro superfamily)
MVDGSLDFRSFWFDLPVPERDVFAEGVESSRGYLNNVALGHKRCGPVLAIKIERRSEGRVRAEKLCPESAAEFEYLRTDGASVAGRADGVSDVSVGCASDLSDPSSAEHSELSDTKVGASQP